MTSETERRGGWDGDGRARTGALRWLRVALLVFAGLALVATDASAWWNTSWSHRRKLTFANGFRAENLIGFQMLVVLNSGRIDYAKTRNDGFDLRFVDANDQTLLDYEIERWDESGDSFVWVRVPQVDASSNSDFIWMYYGNPTAPNVQNAAAVWSGYSMVQHFEESSGQHFDSTSNGNHSVVIDVQSQGAPPPVGRIGATDVFLASSADNVDVADSLTLDMGASDSYVVEAWINTTNAGDQMVLSKENVASFEGEIQLWVTGGVASFWVNDGFTASRAYGTTAVNDGQWHHLVGRWDDGTATVEIFVDGNSEGTDTDPVGANFTSTPFVIGQEGDLDRGFNFDGRIDEVRVWKNFGGSRTNGWIDAQHDSTRDTGAGQVGPFASYGPEAGQCCGLVVNEDTGAGTIVVTGSPNRFDIRFNRATGGGIDRFVDAEEDTGVDLAGGGPGLQPALFSDEVDDGFNATTAADTEGAAVHLLEATPARVKVRQHAFYQRGTTTEKIPALKGYGDYSIYGVGRMAIGWERRANVAIAAPLVQQFQWTVAYTATPPLNAWTGYSQTAVPDPTPFGSGGGAPTATDDFVMAQSEVPGARTDFLAILSQDWPSANQVYFGSRAIENWQEVSWIDDNPAVPVPLGSERWSFLTYFKPTNLANNADAAVTSRSGDYRTPATLTINAGKGSRWGEASENTAAAGDWFNEAEAAYVLDLNPLLGLDFDISGSVPSPRYRPFFKIRQWRSFTETPVVTLEGAALAKDTSFRAALKPVARAHFEKDVTWYSTFESAAAVTTPDVGSGGSVVGADFPASAPFRHGRGARFDTDGEYIQVPTAFNFNPAEGAIEFWYLPSYEFGTGVLTDDQAFFGYQIDVNNTFQAYHQPGSTAPDGLKFLVRSGGVVHVAETGGIGISPVLWRANDWVHLRFVWDNSPQRLEVYVNGRLVVSGATYAAPVGAAPNLYIGDRQVGGFVNNAQGRIDEFRIYDTADSPTELAHGGLAADVREHLSNPLQDYTFTFAQEDASHRGEYLYMGADSKYRGLNVSLATAGVGAGLDLEWQYWDGSAWIDLETTPGFTDQTSHLTQNGTIFWASDPTAWEPYSLRGGPDLYYVRARLKSGAYSGQFPRENVIKTDILLFQSCHDVTAAAQTFVFGVPWPTTEVRLQSFTAAAGDRSVLLSWRTASELHNLGFHLYRSLSADGPWTRLTTALIPGLGSSAVGQAYSYRDAGLSNGTRYFYRLEDVDASSRTTAHGPVSAVPEAGIPAGDESGGGGAAGREKKKDAAAASCPDWVVSAYAASAGPDAATASLRCTRHGDPEATSFSVLSRDARQATLELRTGGFYALHAPSGAGEPAGTVRVFVPGFDFPQDEQTAALPIRRALVEAVVGRRVQLGGVRALEQQSFRGLLPAALGKSEMQVGRDGTVRASRGGTRRLEARDSRVLPRHELVTLLPSQFQGETKSAVVELAPLRYDAQRQLVLAKRLRVRLVFTGREAGESGRGSVGRAPRSRDKAAAGEVLARLHTTSLGLHASTFEQLFAGQARSVRVSELRLERAGEAVAFHVEPARDSFGPGSRLYFHADRMAASTDYASEVAYELVRSREGLRMPVVSAAPGSSALVGESRVTRVFETERFYQPGLLEARDPWLWEAVASGATRATSFSLPGVLGSGTAELEMDLQGASESGNSLDHHVSVSVNGVLVGETHFAGKRPHRVSLSLPASLLREGTNELRLANVADTGVSSLVFLDRFLLSHPQPSSAAGGSFEGLWPQSGTATVWGVSGAPAVVALTASSASAASSSSLAPRWLSGYSASGDAVSFQAEAGRTYLVVSEPLVPRISRPEPSTLRAATNQADYVLIAPRAFLPAAEPLIQRRQDQGLTTRGVALEEIAAEFDHGRASAEAIRSFLAHAFHSWQRPSLRYVLLFGDASYDPRNFIGTSRPAPLPALWTRTSYLWTASDPLLGAVNGEDALPDLAIGRLPATTLEQAHALVQKLLAWEDSGQGLAGAAALVADNPDIAGDFEADVEDIRASFFTARETRMLKLSELGGGMRPSILDALNSGLSFINYVGHGGAAVWASENVWNSWDAGSLQAQSQQPLLVTMNCLNGYFVAPAFESLSESLLKAEGRGAIASFSPSGLSLDGPAHQYHRALMAELTSGRHETLGDAILAAQKSYADSGLMPELIGVYHLLGDPATRIRK